MMAKMRVLMVVFLLSLIILVTPLIVRSLDGNSNLIGAESYYHLRLSEEVKELGILEEDPVQKTEYSFNLFHFLMSLLAYIISFGLLTKIVPIIMGFLSLLFFYLIIKDFHMKGEALSFALLLMIISPLFIYLFSTFNHFSLVVLLALSGAYYFRKNKFIGPVLLSLILLTDFMSFITASILLIVYYVIFRRFGKGLITYFVSSLVLFLIGFLFLHFRIIGSIFSPLSLPDNFVFLGGFVGYSLIFLLLGVIGFAVKWNKDNRHILFYSVMIVLFIGSLFSESIKVFVHLILVVYSSFAIIYFIRRRWDIIVVKNFTLLLVLCILLFSSVNMIVSEISSEPSVEKIKAITLIETSEKKDVILSSESNGFLIEYFGKRQAFLDDNSFRKSDYEKRTNISNTIFYSRDLVLTESLLKENNITHIVVDPEMKSGMIWNREEEGLLFLLENSENFIKLYSFNNIEVYRHIPKRNV
jgi:hypothetical protein